MALELTASRFLAPYFGSSLMIWTNLIGMILAAVSLGNILGGRLADSLSRADQGEPDSLSRADQEEQDPSGAPAFRDRPFFLLLEGTAVWIALLPFVGRYAVAGIAWAFAEISPTLLLSAGSLSCCLVLFGPPSLVLGMTGPFLARRALSAAAAQAQETGSTLGWLSAWASIGSILGTFFPVFIGIPYVGTMKTFLILAGIIQLMVVWAFFRSRQRPRLPTLFLLLVTGLALVAPAPRFAFWLTAPVETESAYEYLLVRDTGNRKALSTHTLFGHQSFLDSVNGLTGGYYDYSLLAPLFLPAPAAPGKPLRMLILGFGGGTCAHLYSLHYPGTDIDGVEIDAKIPEIGGHYLTWDRQRTTIHIGDARAFLAGKANNPHDDNNLYDIVFLDTFKDIAIPFHLATREFFGLVRQRMSPRGVLLMNINLRGAETPDLVQMIGQTAATAFLRVCRHDVNEQQNSLLAAFCHPQAREYFDAALEGLAEHDPRCRLALSWAQGAHEIPAAPLVFSDDWAPVEAMAQRALGAFFGKI
jgi:MFS family permease